jgi:hypothetical protein
MILLGLAVVLMLQNRPFSHDGFLQAFLVPGFATVGAVVAARRRNTIGGCFWVWPWWPRPARCARNTPCGPG